MRQWSRKITRWFHSGDRQSTWVRVALEGAVCSATMQSNTSGTQIRLESSVASATIVQLLVDALYVRDTRSRSRLARRLSTAAAPACWAEAVSVVALPTRGTRPIRSVAATTDRTRRSVARAVGPASELEPMDCLSAVPGTA